VRLNMPVTNIEHTYGDNEFIVSKTDRKGLITYCNEIFMKLAMYDESELLGQPHNIIRHPDMPAAAFADLWNVVQAGREWHGIVKNRCRNGDYYWVDATVTPTFDNNGRIINYMSVRRKPSRQQIEEASSLYAGMLAEEGR